MAAAATGAASSAQRPGPEMSETTTPSVLFVYYTYTQQTATVLDAMAEVLRAGVAR